MVDNIIIKTIAILLVAILVLCDDNNSNEDDIDSVINLLLNGDDIEAEQPDYIEGEQPIFSDGIWICGNCDVIDSNKLIYSEVNELDTNDISNDRPIVVQVGLNLDKMQCVTIFGGATAVRKETGACDGDTVTLSVYNATYFVVKVYGI